MSTNIKPITIGYHTNDFFYTIIGDKMPTDSSCNAPGGYLSIPDSSCVLIDSTGFSGDIWMDNSYNCYKKELCMNKNLALKINDVENNHLGSQQNYLNSKKMYNNEILKTFNLAFGILFIITTIYYVK